MSHIFQKIVSGLLALSIAISLESIMVSAANYPFADSEIESVEVDSDFQDSELEPMVYECTSWSKGGAISTGAVQFTLEAGKGQYYSFTPAVTDTYTFFLGGTIDTCGYLRESTNTSSYLIYDDERGPNSNFLICYSLKAGKTYYLYIQGYNPSVSGQCTLHVTRGSNYSSLASGNTYNNASISLMPYYLNYYSFTPTSTATYYFSTYKQGTTADTVGYLFDKNYQCLKMDDNSGSDKNFSFEYYCTAGITYYVGVRPMNSSTVSTGLSVLTTKSSIPTMPTEQNQAKKGNVITASNYTKTVATTDQSFTISAKTTCGHKPTFASDNKSITIDKNSGKVKISKNYIGKATITISVAECDKYKASKKSVTVTVNPTKPTISSATSTKKGWIALKWKKVTNISGYEVQLSESKGFESGKSQTWGKISTSTTSWPLNGFTSKKTYYARMRTYKTVNGKKYYSAWSAVKSITVK